MSVAHSLNLRSGFYDVDHDDYRASVREFVRREVEPHYLEWEEARLVPRSAWQAAGKNGILGLAVPEQYGGGGVSDFRFPMIVAEELSAVGATSYLLSLRLQDDIVLPYLVDLCTEEQKQRWLPGAVSGELVLAIAMTEPGAGSDLQGIRSTAVRDGDGWILNGAKTFITNGINADLVIVFARTDPDAGSRGFSLFVVERADPGFSRGRKLDKVGIPGQDTAELVFEDVRVGPENVLGEIGEGLIYLMQRLPKERLSLAVQALAASEAAVKWTQDYVFERTAFGKRIGDQQATRFELADLETEVEITRAYVQNAALALTEGTLTAAEASKAKLWATEMQVRVTSRCLQLFGGYGYMNEYPIARAFRDSRVQTIYGGTSQIMKEIIGRDIAGRYPKEAGR
ncbi:acyl-CoA dehydrogenase family protein [Nocardioides sp. WS12]|uniref:acyl-CoA dehydrogenase family protein n=1 Tax=Nocardioides sp. WS12 TaxID=2486272 RepID=UPI0015F7DC5D|nr:acyl-CoA dehydrogenase family protein [Nocardioides sp. WS12]